MTSSEKCRCPQVWAGRAAAGIAAIRVVLGVAALVAPEAAGRAWIGSGAVGRDRAVLGRALGGRDVALGVGALLARRERGDQRLWLQMGAVSDLVDTLATLAAFTQMPERRRWMVVAASGGASLAGVVIAAKVATPA